MTKADPDASPHHAPRPWSPRGILIESLATRVPGGTPGIFGNEHPLVAALHLQPEPGNVPGNLRLAERAVTAAKSGHPALSWVVLPELFTTGYAGLRTIHEHAEYAEGGPSARFFASLASRLGLHLAYGFPERHRAGGVSESANQLGEYPEAGFDTPGGVYGPNGLRLCDRTDARSVAEVDLGVPERWRSSFGSTLPVPTETLAP